MAVPRGPTRRLRDIYLHIYCIYYIMHKVQPSVYRKGIQPSKTVVSYKWFNLFKFFPCGTKVPHSVFDAGDVASCEASDRRRRGNLCVDHVVRGPPIVIKTHVAF